MNRLLVLLLAMSMLLGLWSCSSTKGSLREKTGSYTESAELNFQAGLVQLKKGEHEKAVTYFLFVKSKYPFSKFAALSDLKIADTRFAQEKWLDAAAAYEVFIRLHPRHEEVVYASYQVGISYFKALPKEHFWLPAATARDQTHTQEALNALERFITQYPTSTYVADAIAKKELLFSYLAKHNLYIAGYYEKRGRYTQAFDRYVRLNELFPQTDEACEGLFLAGKIAQNKLKNPDLAVTQYEGIVQGKPSCKHYEQAQKNLNAIRNQTEQNEH
jgi:outer membrane protein assembly factor BamD